MNEAETNFIIFQSILLTFIFASALMWAATTKPKHKTPKHPRKMASRVSR